MAKINDEYDIGAAFEAIENELISSMIRNFENHKQEELDEKKTLVHVADRDAEISGKVQA